MTLREIVAGALVVYCVVSLISLSSQLDRGGPITGPRFVSAP